MSEEFGSISLEEDPISGALTIIRADPRVRIARDIFHRAMADPDSFLPGTVVTREKITITATNGRYVWKITGYDVVTGCFEAQWPD